MSTPILKDENLEEATVDADIFELFMLGDGATIKK